MGFLDAMGLEMETRNSSASQPPPISCKRAKTPAWHRQHELNPFPFPGMNGYLSTQAPPTLTYPLQLQT